MWGCILWLSINWFSSIRCDNLLFPTRSNCCPCLAVQRESSNWWPASIIALGLGTPHDYPLTKGTYPSDSFIICSTSIGSDSSLQLSYLHLLTSSTHKLCSLIKQLINATVFTILHCIEFTSQKSQPQNKLSKGTLNTNAKLTMEKL